MSMSMPPSPWGSYPPPPGTQVAYGIPPNPAYTPVQVRQSFGYEPAQAQLRPQYPPQPLSAYPQTLPTEQPAPKKKVEWPPSVRLYVQKAFDPSNMVPDVQRADMENKLKETISDATANNTLHVIDWDNLLLPQEMIRRERAQVYAPVPWRQIQSGVPNNSTFGDYESSSRKRKSQDVSGANEDGSSFIPPWRSTNGHTPLEDRINYPPGTAAQFVSRPQAVNEALPSKSSSKFQKNLEKRQRRFDGGYKSNYKPSPSPEPNAGPVIGRNQNLEKKYFRLTAAPNPNDVRPEHVLKQTLNLLKKKWRKEGNYSYICDQFKSLRQDLTVQHIKNKFTVEVYEIHARIALEKGDLGEYNQCQTQLRALYGQKLGGNPLEFKAYRILYFIHTGNRTALNDVLADLTLAEKEDQAIKHALGVRSALALGNYHRFFRLYLDTPNMGAYLLDMFIARERLAALANICKAYKPDVKLRFISEELGFESDADAAQFICDYKGQHLLGERETGIQFFTSKAANTFELARSEAFRKIDIKGQI